MSPDGKHVYVAHILARYQMPTTQLERGWMNTNALSIIDAEKKKLVNVILLDDFIETGVDGMSIGSNDLTQLTLGLDRDSGIVNKVADETNPAVMQLIANIIGVCRKRKKYIGICGQAPSDHPGFAEFLVRAGIESISLNSDTVVKTTVAIARQEKKLKKTN